MPLVTQPQESPRSFTLGHFPNPPSMRQPRNVPPRFMITKIASRSAFQDNASPIIHISNNSILMLYSRHTQSPSKSILLRQKLSDLVYNTETSRTVQSLRRDVKCVRTLIPRRVSPQFSLAMHSYTSLARVRNVSLRAFSRDTGGAC